MEWHTRSYYTCTLSVNSIWDSDSSSQFTCHILTVKLVNQFVYMKHNFCLRIHLSYFFHIFLLIVVKSHIINIFNPILVSVWGGITKIRGGTMEIHGSGCLLAIYDSWCIWKLSERNSYPWCNSYKNSRT